MTDHLSRLLLVTGGGSGIGAAIARKAADRGHTVVIVGRRREALDRVAEHSGNIRPMPADLQSPATVAEVVSTVADRFGRIDGVVANAGTMVVGTVAETSVDDWQRAIDLNLSSAFVLAKESIPHLRATHGTFVAIGSIAGIRAPKGAAAYAISKSALGMLVATIAVEEAANGVRANCLNPGWVRTEMADSEMDEFGGHIGQTREQAYATVTALVPQGRPAEPSEVADAAIWLLGPESSYVNGASITIDGGTTLVDPGTVPFDFKVGPR